MKAMWGIWYAGETDKIAPNDPHYDLCKQFYSAGWPELDERASPPCFYRAYPSRELAEEALKRTPGWNQGAHEARPLPPGARYLDEASGQVLLSSAHAPA
ncbi:hypothetical protein BN1110_06291 [bacterium YEK0313]|nr:hypothetical protein BN1110_06291 [bacterium YEK0313]